MSFSLQVKLESDRTVVADRLRQKVIWPYSPAYPVVADKCATYFRNFRRFRACLGLSPKVARKRRANVDAELKPV